LAKGFLFTLLVDGFTMKGLGTHWTRNPCTLMATRGPMLSDIGKLSSFPQWQSIEDSWWNMWWEMLKRGWRRFQKITWNDSWSSAYTTKVQVKQMTV
jgi:hypothetical protein